MRNTKVVSISLPAEMLKAAEIMAKQENRTMSELMREALRVYQRERLAWQDIFAYGEANAVFSAAKKTKESLAPVIRGLRGTAGEWRISLGKGGVPKDVPDEAAIAADYAAQGLLMPMTTKPGDAPRLSVTRLKKAAQ